MKVAAHAVGPYHQTVALGPCTPKNLDPEEGQIRIPIVLEEAGRLFQCGRTTWWFIIGNSVPQTCIEYCTWCVGEQAG